MSGVKYTQFELEQEEKARQQALSDLRREQSVIHGMKKRMNEIMTSMPSGVRESFATETRQAESWLRRSLPADDSTAGSSVLKSRISEVRQMANDGVSILDELINIVEHRRDEKAAELRRQCTDLHVQLDGHKELLDKWRQDHHASFSQKTDAIITEIDEGDFIAAQQRLTSLRKEIDRETDKALSLEHQDQERRFVLEALEEVCAEMGWKVIHTPTLEQAEDPGSDLIFMANTYTSGKMEFRLSLEGITVDSPITHVGKVCHHDFGTVSDKLRNLGVKTAFKQVNPTADVPRLLAKGALNLPVSGKTRTMKR